MLLARLFLWNAKNRRALIGWPFWHLILLLLGVPSWRNSVSRYPLGCLPRKLIIRRRIFFFLLPRTLVTRSCSVHLPNIYSPHSSVPCKKHRQVEQRTFYRSLLHSSICRSPFPPRLSDQTSPGSFFRRPSFTETVSSWTRKLHRSREHKFSGEKCRCASKRNIGARLHFVAAAVKTGAGSRFSCNI